MVYFPELRGIQLGLLGVGGGAEPSFFIIIIICIGFYHGEGGPALEGEKKINVMPIHVSCIIQRVAAPKLKGGVSLPGGAKLKTCCKP